MAIKISALPAESGSAEGYFVPASKGGFTRKIPVESIAALGGSGSGTVTTVKVSVSSAEILQLFTTPKTLVASPGAGKRISIDKIHFVNHFGTTPYTVNVNLAFEGGAVNVITATGVLGQGSDYFMSMRPSSSLAGSAGLPDTDVPLIMYTLSGNPVGGDGTMDIYITYTVITF